MKVQCISLDIGGVLVGDVWEIVILHDRFGVAKQLRLDRETTAQICARLWRNFCVRDCTEDQYWEAFQKATGKRPSKEQIALAESQVWTDPSLHALIRFCEAHSICLSICSESTAFWFDKQKNWLPALDLITAPERLLSFAMGLYKDGEDTTLFNILANTHDPASTLVVDDRQHNLQRAASLGFDVLRYCGPPEGSRGVFTAIKSVLN